MRKILIGLSLVSCFLLFATTGFAAAKWVPVTNTAGENITVDVNSLKKTGNILEFNEQTKSLNGSSGQKNEVVTKQYDLSTSKVKNLSTTIYNAKGVKLGAKKAAGKWEKLKANSSESQAVKMACDWSRKLGAWTKVKDISDLAVKYFDSSTIKRSKGNAIDVWEKLELNKTTNNIKSVVSNVKYDIKKHTATTVYTCNYDAKGNLVSSSSNVDNWAAAEDTYGEYIGEYLDDYLKKNKKK